MKNHLPPTDIQLIRLFQEGNAAALETLVYRHKERLFSSILFLVKDKYLAEDLFQDTFIKIIDTVRNNKYTEEGKFLPWAMRIAHNLCVDHFRKIKRDPIVKTNDNNDVFEAFTFAEEAPDKNIMQSQTQDQIKLMLEELPAEQREVIVLRHYADLSFKEIATMTNCSINTALGRMRYGLINLRRLVAEKQIAL